jgi:hypothetical protein
LIEVIGAALVIRELIAIESTDFLTATDTVLQAEYQSTLAEAWLEFTRWNLFTEERADSTRAYLNGANLVSVLLESPVVPSDSGAFEVSQQTEGMSARYTPIVLPDIGGALRRLSIVTESSTPAVGTAYLWKDGALGEPMALEPDPDDPKRANLDLSWQGQSSLYLVVTGVGRGSPMRTVTISMGLPPEQVPIGDEGGCRVAAGRSGSSGGLFLMALGAVLVWFWCGPGAAAPVDADFMPGGRVRSLRRAAQRPGVEVLLLLRGDLADAGRRHDTCIDRFHGVLAVLRGRLVVVVVHAHGSAVALEPFAGRGVARGANVEDGELCKRRHDSVAIHLGQIVISFSASSARPEKEQACTKGHCQIRIDLGKRKHGYTPTLGSQECTASAALSGSA